ncbi:MAG: hypothetical protein MI799_05530 [Desulfobacterales bacterium]|nr:hypothetical protein [Desulfobacterales bacterium]
MQNISSGRPGFCAEKTIRNMLAAVCSGVISGAIVQWLFPGILPIPWGASYPPEGIIISDPSSIAGRYSTWAILVFTAYIIICRLPDCIPNAGAKQIVRWVSVSAIGILVFIIITQADTPIVDADPIIRGNVPDTQARYFLLVKPSSSDCCSIHGPVIPNCKGRFENQVHIGGFGYFTIIIIGEAGMDGFPLKAGETLAFQDIAGASNVAFKTVKRI